MTSNEVVSTPMFSSVSWFAGIGFNIALVLAQKLTSIGLDAPSSGGPSSIGVAMATTGVVRYDNGWANTIMASTVSGMNSSSTWLALVALGSPMCTSLPYTNMSMGNSLVFHVSSLIHGKYGTLKLDPEVSKHSKPSIATSTFGWFLYGTALVAMT